MVAKFLIIPYLDKERILGNAWDYSVFTFFDLLGFKYAVRNVPQEKLATLMMNLAHCTNIAKGYGGDPTELETHLKNWENPIKSVHFSDAIIVFTEDDSIEAFKHILWVAISLLGTGFSLGFCLRGALSYGSFYYDLNSNIYFGEPLIEAYMMETQQEWAGCVLTRSCIKVAEARGYLDDAVIYSKFERYENGVEKVSQRIRIPLLVKYKVPLKGGAEELYCVNWPNCWVSSKEVLPMRQKIIELAFHRPFGMVSFTGKCEVTNKLKNTLDFLWSRFE